MEKRFGIFSTVFIPVFPVAPWLVFILSSTQG
jgi:hypothetical protein